MTEQGWQPDPNDPRKLRFRDGNGWTDFTKPNPDASAAAAPPPSSSQSQSSQPSGFGQSQPPGQVRLPGRSNQGAQGQQPGQQPGQPNAPRDPYAQAQQPDPYAAAAPSAQDPYSQQPAQAAPSQNWGTPAPPQQQSPQTGEQGQQGQQYGNAPHDPYAQPGQQQGQQQGGQQQGPQPSYVQQQAPRPDGFAGQVHGFNDRIAQGYGDQSFGGQMTGPAGHRQAESGRSVFTEKTLIVSQKRKIIEVTNEYSIYAADGSTLGAVVEVGQSSMRKVLRVMTNYDQFLTHRLEVRDNHGQVLLQLTRPAKVMKSSVIVQDPQGREIGRLIQRNVFGKIRFGLEANGQEIGSLNAENWRAWNFAVLDGQGTEVARVTKTWEGLLTTMFTTADNYAVNIHYDLPEPLRSLCIAAALTIDTALKQDDR